MFKTASKKKIVFARLIPILVSPPWISCGPAYPLKEAPLSQASPSISSTTDFDSDEQTLLTQSLNFKVVPDSKVNRSILIQRNQISFGEILNPLRGSFFEWPETVAEGKILQSWVSYQILGGNNRWIESSAPIAARYEGDSHRWFISILELLGNSSLNSQEGDLAANLVSMKLEIILSNQKRAVIEVRFRIRGLQ